MGVDGNADADLRYSEAAVIERRVEERRRRDRVTHWLVRASMVALVGFNIVGWSKFDNAQERSAENQAQLTRLVCDTLTEFIAAPPDLARDQPALDALAEECQALQRRTRKAAKE